MKIMLVDDDITSLEVLHDVLVLNDFECDAFDNPEDALASYENGKYVAVLTDYLMQSMNGIDLLRAIKSKDPDSTVIMYSACDEEHLDELAISNGAYIYFSKPISWIDIEKVLQELQKISQVKHSLMLEMC